MIARLVERLDKVPAMRLAAQQISHWLERLGLWPTPPDRVADIEGLMEHTLQQVNTRDGFRNHLGRNLALAAQRKTAGYTVARPRSWRPRLMLMISAGLLMAMITALVLALRYRPTTADR
jgi:hypothetical protein